MRPTGRGADPRASRSAARVRMTRVNVRRLEVAVERNARSRADSRGIGGPVVGRPAERLVEHRVVHPNGLLRSREPTRGDVGGPRPGPRGDRLLHLGVTLRVFWREVAEPDEI